MTTKKVDLAVLGGGAAGLSAVREARRRDATALIINDGPLGGDCTFTGCVPSKTIIEASLAGLGFSEAFERARSVVAHIAGSESAEVLRSEGVDVVEAEGSLVGSGLLRADGVDIEAQGIVLALGSRPFVPPIPGLDGIDALTSETLWALTESPRSMLVIGGGAIGCELGQALARLGIEITLVELAPRLLIRDEQAAASIVEAELTAAGVDVRTGVSVDSVAAGAGGATATLSDGSTVHAERVLVAVGRRPNSDRGGLSEADLELDDRGYIVTKDDLTTSLSGVYAAGDVSGKLQFTHAADHMGRIAAGNILGRFGRKRFKAEEIPRVTFTNPEVASIGLSEAEAASQVKGAMVAELPLAEHDRALAADATRGYIKLIAGPKPLIGNAGGGRLIGATIVADRAGEMISELSLALRQKVFIGHLALTVHPYPTWSYGIPKAAAQFFTTIEGRTARPASSDQG